MIIGKQRWFLLTAVLLIAASGMMVSALGRKEPFPDPGDTAQMRIEDPIPVDSAVRKGRLPNGLTYYIRRNTTPEKRAVLRLAVNAGSILEDADQQGLAHFTEHMAFNGTEHFAEHQLIDYLESIGMKFGPEINAHTGFDETVYKLTIPTDNAEAVDKAFFILSDWAANLSFDPVEIDKERGVVIEEWRLGRGAQARMRDKYFPVLFSGSRYADRLPIGKKSILENFKDNTLIRFYKDWYRPDLMAVVAVGDFDPDKIEGLIKKYFSSLSNPPAERPRTEYPVPDHKNVLYSIVTDPEATSTTVELLTKHDPREMKTVSDYRDMVIGYLYDNMMNQRLDELTQQADPPFIYAFSSDSPFVRTKSVYDLGAVVPEDGIMRGFTAILTEAERVRTYGFTEGELERAKKRLFSMYKKAFEERNKTESRPLAEEYTRNFLDGEAIPGIAWEYELFKRYSPGITLGDVNALTEKVITAKNRVLLITGPESARAKMPTENDLAGLVSNIDSMEVTPYRDIVSGRNLFPDKLTEGKIASQKEFPAIGVTQLTLGNGVTVVLKPTDFRNKEIVMSAFSPGGTSLVSDDDYISALMLPSILGVSGVGDFSAVDLQKMLSGKRVSVSPKLSELTEGFSGSCSPEDLETMLQLVYLYAVHPREDKDAFTSLKTRLSAMLENRESMPEVVFQDKVQELISQNHFRRRPLTPKILEEMDLSRAFRVYRDRFGDMGDFTFFFAGNFSLDTIIPLAEKYLGNLPSSGRKEHWKDIGVDFPKKSVSADVHAGIEPKSRVALVFGGEIPWTEQRENMFNAMLQVLDIKLRETIREDASGTYGVRVSGYLTPYPKNEYRVQISFGCDPDRAEELTGMVKEEIGKLQNAPPEQIYMTKVKEGEQRSWEDSLQKNSFWTGLLSDAYLYKLPMATLTDYQKKIAMIDAKGISEMAGEVFNFGRYVQCILFPENDKKKNTGGKNETGN